jgi:hypothetical protein
MNGLLRETQVADGVKALSATSVPYWLLISCEEATGREYEAHIGAHRCDVHIHTA